MRKVVLDTNIFISGIFWQGKSNEILQKAMSGEIKACISEEMLQELTTVLKRDFEVTEDRAEKVVESITLYAEIIKTKSTIKVVKDDPADDKILECATDSQAEFVVSKDKHLLKLQRFQDTKIITPRDFLELISK